MTPTTEVYSLDLETLGIDPRREGPWTGRGEIEIASWAEGPPRPADHAGKWDKLTGHVVEPDELPAVLEYLGDRCQAGARVAIHNGYAFDMPILHQRYPVLAGRLRVVDTLLLCKLWQPDWPASLDHLCQQLGYSGKSYKAAKAAGPEAFRRYAKDDAVMGLDVFWWIWHQLAAVEWQPPRGWPACATG